jgi:hypothetical protein
MQPQVDIPIAGEVSANQDDLNAKIDAELNIAPPQAPPVAPEPPVAPPAEPVVEPEQPVEPPAEEEPVEPEEAEPEPLAEPAIPTDTELFIEVEDGDGVTHKISQIEDLPADFTPKNNRQIIEIVSQLTKLDNQREANEVKAASEAEVKAQADIQTAQFKSWDTEIGALAKDKRIEATNTDRINDVFGYMNEINAARTKAGNPNLVTSFEDALDKFEAKESKDAAIAAEKNGNDLAKQKSAIIGKSSAAAGGDTYVYRAGSARNIDDIPL